MFCYFTASLNIKNLLFITDSLCLVYIPEFQYYIMSLYIKLHNDFVV